MNVVSLKLPAHLEPKCQALLTDIQQASGMSQALFAERRALAYAESLGVSKAITPDAVERLLVFYQRALTNRLAEWDV